MTDFLHFLSRNAMLVNFFANMNKYFLIKNSIYYYPSNKTPHLHHDNYTLLFMIMKLKSNEKQMYKE